jgi:hypothetical protein
MTRLRCNIASQVFLWSCRPVELSGYPIYRPTQGRRKSVGENRLQDFDLLRLSIARKGVK